jgi:4-amino-4-deoxy-L-arabinose transferase-like glycosyltransferase
MIAMKDMRAGRVSTNFAWFVLILSVALLIRVFTFNGFFGSDDLTYYESAKKVADGDWVPADYNGALRYGFNIPAGTLINIFGDRVFAANLWSLICSLTEISVVFWGVGRIVDPYLGRVSALLLCFAPLHVAVSTRVHADPVVSMCVTAGFVLLLLALKRRSKMQMFAAGLVVGFIFWVKELVSVIWLSYLLMLGFFRGKWFLTVPILAGGLSVMVAHFAFMYWIAGDPLYLIKTVLGQVERNFIQGGQGESAPFYYVKYLVADIRHIGLLGVYSLVGGILVFLSARVSKQSKPDFIFFVCWAAGLFAVLSFFPVSFSPLRFAMKQSNYLTIFLAPLAILAAVFVSLCGKFRFVIMGAAIGLGIVLSLLQQADYRAYVANSWSLAKFAVKHPDALIVGSVNNTRLGSFMASYDYPGMASARFIRFDEASANNSNRDGESTSNPDVFVILDPMTLNKPSDQKRLVAKACWEPYGEISPEGLGVGNEFARMIYSATEKVRTPPDAIRRLAFPTPAHIFRVRGADLWCGENAS